MSRIKSYFFSSFGDIFSRGVNWLLLFFIPFFITEEAFGRVSMIWISIQLFGAIFSYGLNKAILRYFHQQENKRSYLQTLFLSWMGINLIMALIFAIVLKFGVSSSLGIDDSTLSAVLLIISVLYFSFRQLYLSFLIIDKRSNYYAFNQFFFGIFKLTVILSAVYFYETSFAYLISISSVSVVFLITDSFCLRKFLGTQFDFKVVKKSYILGLPLMLNVISGSLLSYFDRFYLENYYGYSEVGIYSFAYTFATGIAFIYGPLVIIFEPKIYESSNSKLKVSKLFSLFRSSSLMGTLTLALLVVLLFPSIVSFLFSEAYLPAEKIIKLVLLGTILNVFYLEGNFKLTLKEKTKNVPVVTAISCIVNIVLNFILIPKFQLKGAALATFISYLLQAVLMLFMANDKIDPSKLLRYAFSRETLIISLLVVATINSFTFYGSITIILAIELRSFLNNYQFLNKKVEPQNQ